MNENQLKWHRLTGDEILRRLSSNAASGLSSKEARARLKKQKNQGLYPGPTSQNGLLRELLADYALLWFVTLSLLAMGFSELFSGLLGLIPVALFVVLLSRALLRMGRLEDRLRALEIPTVSVIRNGKKQAVSARQIVAGDVILLRRGDIVPADCRLLNAADLRVRLTYGQGQAKKTVVQIKKAGTVYGYQDEIYAPDCENMVYGGSEVLNGRGKAVAVAVEEDCFLCLLGDVSRNDWIKWERGADPATEKILPYFRLLGFCSLLLMLVLMLVGILTAPEEQSVWRVVLPIAAWAALFSAALPSCYFRMTLHREWRALYGEERSNQKILIKNAAALDSLTTITDLFLVERGAITDGKQHLEACRTEQQFSEQALCEAFCLLSIAKSRLPVSVFGDERTEEPYLNEMITSCNYDAEALKVRVKRLELFLGVDEQLLDVETKERSYRLRFRSLPGESDPALWDCRATEVWEEQGAYAKCVGRIFTREGMLPSLRRRIADLEQKGIRVRLFSTSEGSLSRGYGRELLPNTPEILFTEHPDLESVLYRNRLFFGYDGRSIVKAVKSMRRSGRRVAVVTDDVALAAMLRKNAMIISCYEKWEKGALSDCPSMLKRDAELLIPAVSDVGGGLEAICTAVEAAKRVPARMDRLFKLLMTVRLLQTAFVAFSVIAGLGSLPVVGVVLSIIPSDLAILWLVLRPQSPQAAPVRFHDSYFKGYFSRAKHWLIPLLPPAALAVALAILNRLSLITAEGCYLCMFFTMLVMESALLGFERDIRMSKRSRLILWLLLGLPVALTVAVPFLPMLSARLDLEGWGITTAIVAAVGAAGGFLTAFLPKCKRNGKGSD